ncbi:MAG: guanine permease [Verrucomicrobia bacterium]|nr:MAG: guanine permease [Verrucomicrobiota bacterium]
MELLDKFFKIRERNSSVGREALAGLVTFFAMSYILAVNPAILAQAGMDKAELVTVTAVAAAIGCALMAFMANLPVALAPTMGTNTYFAIIVCVGMGLDWREALALTFYNGIFFFIISVTGIREKLIAGVPRPMQAALQCGIGMFIAFFGLQSAKLVVSNPATLVTGGRIGSPECLFALAGVALIAVLVARKVRSAIIISIAAMTAAAFFIDDSSGARMAKIPNAVFSIPHGISETFMQLDFAYPFRDFHKAARVIFVLLMLDLLDTIATVVAMASRCGIMRPDGTFPKMGRALTADASATIIGALLGTSTTGAFVESSAGIESGGRTGLTPLFTGAFFIAALFLSPLINAVPAAATAPALIVIGILMFGSISQIKFSDLAELIPVFFCIMMVALCFKISEGFAFGMVAYVLLMCATGRAREILPATWLLFSIMCVFLCAA